MKTKPITAAVAASLIAVSAAGLAQQVVVPADSTTGSARATVAINAAGMQTQINQLAARPDGTVPWTRGFAGQSRSTCGGTASGAGGCAVAYLDASGMVYMIWPDYWGNASQWVGVGYTSGGLPVSATFNWCNYGPGCNLIAATVVPTAFDANGRALDWALRMAW
jgi:hypothetical protein